MDQKQQFQKVVNISYLACGALLWFLTQAAMMYLANLYDLESRINSIEYIVRGVAILLGLGTFVALYVNSKVNTFMNEVAAELLTKTTWPTKKETTSGTIVVIITVLIAGILLGVFDWIWTEALKLVI